MRRSRLNTRIGITIATLVLASAFALAAPGSSTPELTVGDFLLMYARSLQITLPADATPETAVAVLKAANAMPSFEPVLDRAITHGDAVKIGRAAGLRISSSTPERSLDRAEADLFLETFAKYLAPVAPVTQDRIGASDNPTGDPANRANTTKGKKKGRPFQSPTEPEP